MAGCRSHLGGVFRRFAPSPGRRRAPTKLTTMSTVSRRGLLGYAGATGVGAAAGFAGGWAVKPVSAAERHQVLNQRYSPHGVHQPGILTPTAAANQLVALDLLPATDAAALGRLMLSVR